MDARTQSLELASVTVARLANLNRRTMDQLAAKVYFYYGRLHELVGGPDSLASIRPCAVLLTQIIALFLPSLTASISPDNF